MGTNIAYDGGLTAWVGTRDIDRAIAWYQDVLGFELQYKMDEMGWCEMRTPIDRVLFGISQLENVDPKGGTTLTLGVKDIEAARKVVEAREVKFDGETIVIDGMVKLATFYDPDGNKLMFYQSLKDAG
ncbi:MAG: VOC family protein [Planctomycetes bacterium]|nr:VOC family protein [Planctomycetota bacterium]